MQTKYTQKLSPSYLAVPLAKLFNNSLETGIIPVGWKSLIIWPIYKKGSKNDFANYRPVCLTSVVCKILERIWKANIRQYLKKSSLLSDAQHGFVPRRSCQANLIIAEELITGMTDQGEPVDAVNLDFSNAFDSVCHRLLFKKMEAMGIHPKVNHWVEDFPNNRTFRVKLGDRHSTEGTVKSGEPQGSVLGPLLFLIFISDFSGELTCNYLFFADDVKLIAPRSHQSVKCSIGLIDGISR